MLWYKAWLETRSRFLLSLFGILALCSYTVLHGEQQAEPWAPHSYYNSILWGGYWLLVMTWILAVTLLMMGGLLREQALGSASFTLGLPVSRRRLMIVRIGVGSLQALTIAILPSAAMYLIASFWKKPFSISQILFHLVLILAGGAVVFAVSLLVSSLVSGEYTAPVVSFGVLLLISAMFGSPKMRQFSPLAFMMGTEYRDLSSNLLIGPIPWIESAIFLCLAVLLVWGAVLLIEQKEF